MEAGKRKAVELPCISVGKIAYKYGHEIVRLPPYHCQLTLFKPGFFWLSLTRGWNPPPPENNVAVELGQCNFAHVFTCQKITPVLNLVAIAQSMTSL